MPDFFGQTMPSNWIEENFQSKKSILLDASICCYDILSGFPTLGYRLFKSDRFYSDKRAVRKMCKKKCTKIYKNADMLKRRRRKK